MNQLRDHSSPSDADAPLTIASVRGSEFDVAAYRELLDVATHRTLFHSPAWWAAFTDFPGASAHLLYAKRGEKMVAAMPYAVFRRFGFRAYFSTGFSAYGGPIARPGEDEAERAILVKFAAMSRGFLTAIASIQDPNARCGVLATEGFTRSVFKTHVAPLPAKFEDLLLTIKITPNELTRAARDGYVIEPSQDPQDFRIWSEMSKSTYQAHGRRPYPPAFFAMVEAMVRRGDFATLRVARRPDGKLAGGIITLHDRDAAHYWQSAVDKGNKGVIDSLLASAMKDSIERGAKTFDFGASPPDASGLAAFKAKWGGQPREVAVYLRQNSLGAVGAALLRSTSQRRRGRP